MSTPTLGFIACAPGSGSTAFITGLNVHAQVLGLHESGLCNPHTKGLQNRYAWLKDNPEGGLPCIVSLARSADGKPLRENPRSLQLQGGFLLQDFHDREGFATHLRDEFKPEATAVVEKDPVISQHLPIIHRLWPNVKLFWLDRDPMAVVQSIIRKFTAKPDVIDEWRVGINWGPTLIPDPTRHVSLTVRAAKQVLACRQAAEAMEKAGKLTVVSYEAWTEDPIKEYNKIYAELGLETLPLDTQPIVVPKKDRLGAWQEEMPKEKQAIARAVLRATWKTHHVPAVVDWTTK